MWVMGHRGVFRGADRCRDLPAGPGSHTLSPLSPVRSGQQGHTVLAVLRAGLGLERIGSAFQRIQPGSSPTLRLVLSCCHPSLPPGLARQL